MPYNHLISGHRIGKGQFSFQSQRKARPKNVQITLQLLSFHMLARLCSKPFNLGFSSIWTKNFQMYKLDLEKAEEREIKLTTFIGSQRKQGNSRKTSTSASLTTLKPLTVWVTTNWRILKETGIPDHLASPEKPVCSQQASENQTWNSRLVPNRERSMSRLYIVTLLI